jgi:GT2 family glycosyltransferase
MQFGAAFWNVLRSRPMTAISALYWRATGRKVRARNRLRIGLAQRSDAYQRWITIMEQRSETALAAPRTIHAWASRPLFSVIMLPNDRWTKDSFTRLQSAMQSQVYPDWELILILPDAVEALAQVNSGVRVLRAGKLDERAQLRRAAEAAMGDFILPLPFDAQLPPTALFRYVEALQVHPDAVMLFGDQDRVDRQGQRHAPWFKTAWNGELALAQDYVTAAVALSTKAARDAFERDLVGPDEPVYSLALAVARAQPLHVEHIPHVQIHTVSTEVTTKQPARMAAVRDHLLRHGENDLSVLAGAHGTIRVDHPLPVPAPLVSIIIPTRDKVHLLKACISSLLALTRYPRFEILIVDNASAQKNALSYLSEIAQHPSIRVIRDDRPYNFSQLNNMAVSHAQGSYLCLLNNDTEIVDGNWLDALMQHATRDEVGAVGARLVYDDGTIQHAGVTIGLGRAAGHPHRFQHKDAIGYFARTHATQFVSAVTAACLVVSRDRFLAVGGLDEKRFAIAFNDVDLCLKLQAKGWRNIYTPYATLIHHESKSRGKDVSPRHIERYRAELDALQSQWGTADYIDPLHNPNLDSSNEHNLINLTVTI